MAVGKVVKMADGMAALRGQNWVAMKVAMMVASSAIWMENHLVELKAKMSAAG